MNWTERPVALTPRAAMSVLVAYASRHGATRGVAERIADRLGGAGLHAEPRHIAGALRTPAS